MMPLTLKRAKQLGERAVREDRADYYDIGKLTSELPENPKDDYRVILWKQGKYVGVIEPD